MAASNRKGILSQIRNPLGFFSLALLIIEGSIGFVIYNSKMDGVYQFVSVCIMASLFLIVIIIVAYITVRWPQHLYEEIAKKIDTIEAIQEFVDSEGFKDIVEYILEMRVKDDCLKLKTGAEKDG